MPLKHYTLATLERDLSDYTEYVGSDNGVHLYKITGQANTVLPGEIHVLDVNLYFVEEKLVTVFINVEDKLSNLDILLKYIETRTGKKGELKRSRFSIKYTWTLENEIIILVKEQLKKQLYLYHSLAHYNVF